MKSVVVVGASGYAGRELCALVEGHPSLRLAARMSARAGTEPEPPASELDLPQERLDPERFAQVDGVFLCTPHGAASELARAAVAAGTPVVDLSADFRLRDPARYAATYGAPHGAPELCAQAVYGLTERRRPALRGARLVANPGCYPTAILLALEPLLAEGLVAPGTPIVADAKSGVSGAGKTPSEATLFGNVHENLRPYNVGRHRHAAEIHQEAGSERIVFVPHLLPCFRGILATLYLSPAPGVDAAAARSVLAEAYAGEPFVRVLQRDLPELARVQGTNACHLAVADAYGQVVVMSAIDNLVKGAAGQALQNMNLLLGLEEGAGLACA